MKQTKELRRICTIAMLLHVQADRIHRSVSEIGSLSQLGRTDDVKQAVRYVDREMAKMVRLLEEKDRIICRILKRDGSYRIKI